MKIHESVLSTSRVAYAKLNSHEVLDVFAALLCCGAPSSFTGTGWHPFTRANPGERRQLTLRLCVRLALRPGKHVNPLPPQNIQNGGGRAILFSYGGILL